MKRRKQHITQEKPLEPYYRLPEATTIVQAEALAMANVEVVAEYPHVTRDPEKVEAKARALLARLREQQADKGQPLTNDFHAFCELFIPLYVRHYLARVTIFDQEPEHLQEDRAIYDACGSLECLLVMRAYFLIKLEEEKIAHV